MVTGQTQEPSLPIRSKQYCLCSKRTATFCRNEWYLGLVTLLGYDTLLFKKLNFWETNFEICLPRFPRYCGNMVIFKLHHKILVNSKMYLGNIIIFKLLLEISVNSKKHLENLRLSRCVSKVWWFSSWILEICIFKLHLRNMAIFKPNLGNK